MTPRHDQTVKEFVENLRFQASYIDAFGTTTEGELLTRAARVIEVLDTIGTQLQLVLDSVPKTRRNRLAMRATQEQALAALKAVAK